MKRFSSQDNLPAFVAVTAAYNEGDHIERLILSVVNQTIRPLRWVIVNDASSDRTSEIVAQYAKQYPFIRLHNITEAHRRNFAAQVFAINAGIQQMNDVEYDFIGNLDADVSFSAMYFEDLLAKFVRDPGLGLGGGWICENDGELFRPRTTNSRRSVPQAVQVFRRECFEGCGGYAALPYGGADWHAEVRSRMNGWRVESFPDLPVEHHRATGSAGGKVRSCYREGLMDYSLGSHPVFEIAKTLKRLHCRPFVVGAGVRLSAFVAAGIRREKRAVSPEFIQYLQAEQLGRLWGTERTLGDTAESCERRR